MSPVPLSSEDWQSINNDLPDVEFVCNRFADWPYAEWITDFTEKGQIKVSSVCFRQAGEKLRNARYALGQAVGVRKYFLDQSEIENDNPHVLADIRSRFYADYVPQLLYGATYHLLKGLELLFDIERAKRKKGDYPLLLVLKAFQNEAIKRPELKDILSALTTFDNSAARKKISDYREAWIHNQPPRVETTLYSPTRDNHKVKHLGNVLMVVGGSELPPFVIKWDDLISCLKEAVEAEALLLNICVDAWEIEHAGRNPNNTIK